MLLEEGGHLELEDESKVILYINKSLPFLFVWMWVGDGIAFKILDNYSEDSNCVNADINCW